VQYVKICSLYGAGFFYIPGSDTCLKIGGYVRTEGGYGNALGSVTTGPIYGATSSRLSNDFIWRARGYATFDIREQSAYGTVRGYMAIGYLWDNSTISGNAQSATASNISTSSLSSGLSVNRAFVQFAGFTMGVAPSFYDLYSSAAVGFFGAYPNSDSGDGGVKTFAYTAQFGNGFSGTLGVEESQRTQVWVLNGANNLSATALTSTPAVPGDPGYGGFHWPDVVANLRVDQAWGSAQIMAMAHEVDPAYYVPAAALPSTGVGSGHPSDKVGYALGAGIKINVPQLGPGDWIQAQFNYTVGDSKIQFRSLGGGNALRWNGGNFGYGAVTDAVTNAYAVGAGLDLTKTIGFSASYEHFWNKVLHTTLYGGWAKVTYSDAASASICSSMAATVMTFAAATPCGSQNWSTWAIGSRTQWDITKWFYVGVDIMYSKLQTANNGATVTTLAANGAQPGGTVYSINNQDAWAMRWRVHRDFGF